MLSLIPTSVNADKVLKSETLSSWHGPAADSAAAA
jgi:hypothetical protein